MIWFAASAHAQDMPLPDLPDLPGLPSDMFDPSNPLASMAPPTPSSIDPIAPSAVPSDLPQSAATLPLPADEETFDFFQSGKQIRDQEEGNLPPLIATPGDSVEEKPKPVVSTPPRPRFQKRFDYRRQILPEPIYSKQYSNENRHLPVARWESDYDAMTFHAAATNNVNGLRALIQSGRNPFMVNGRGESLVTVAARHGAHGTLRYLLAKGVNPQPALQQAHATNDARAIAALRSAGAY